MPFLNDMMEETARRRQSESALEAENGLEADVVARHLSHRGLKTRFQFDIGLIEEHLRSVIIGQEDAVQHVLDILNVVRADIGDPRRPLATALFLGPTGVGKTELVRAVARALHGDADALCRVDMNTLSQEHYAAALTGAPPGYVGSKEGTTILDQDKIEGSHGRPGIVLFDEMEKASPEVTLALLNVFDNGMLTVASGERTYSFRNAIVFMTSNLATRQLQALEDGAFAKLRSAIAARGRPAKVLRREIAEKALLKRFPPEFVNRLDHIEVFNPIRPRDMAQLVEIELKKLNRRLAKHSCTIVADADVKEYLAAGGYDRVFGARALRRFIRQKVEVPFAQFLIEAYVSPEHASQDIRFCAQRIGNEIAFKKAKRAG